MSEALVQPLNSTNSASTTTPSQYGLPERLQTTPPSPIGTLNEHEDTPKPYPSLMTESQRSRALIDGADTPGISTAQREAFRKYLPDDLLDDLL